MSSYDTLIIIILTLFCTTGGISFFVLKKYYRKILSELLGFEIRDYYEDGIFTLVTEEAALASWYVDKFTKNAPKFKLLANVFLWLVSITLLLLHAIVIPFMLTFFASLILRIFI